MLRQMLREGIGRLQGRSNPHRFRKLLAQEFIRGAGLEIGALHAPLWLPPGATVRYVDRMDVAGLRRHYPELDEQPLVPVDVIDDGERLETVAAVSQDFVIANHFLEHTQDPIGTIRCHLQVLKPGGVLYLAVPDKRWTFDKQRPVTALEHLYRDHEEGPAWSYLDHMREWAELVNHQAGSARDPHVEMLVRANYSIHFHVWTQKELLEMLVDIRRRLGLPFEIEALLLNRALGENIAVLRKT